MNSWQPPLDLQGLGSTADGLLPRLYLVCALSHIDPDVRHQLEPLVELVKVAVREASLEAEHPWELSVYAPIEHSAPWNRPALEPETVYKTNAERLQGHTDGLIMFGHNGGSYGGGQEFAWAAAMRLPILYITPAESLTTGEGRLSRQIEGTPLDLTVCSYHNPTDLREQVKNWVRTRRATLEALARHRADRGQVHEHLHRIMRHRWSEISSKDRASAIMECGMHPRRIEALITDLHAFAAASLEEVTALMSALGLSLTVRGDQLPDLTARQRAALATAAWECQWSPAKTLELEGLARRELARGGVRRIALTTPHSWIELDERHSR